MINTIFKNCFSFLFFMLLQVTVLNNITILGWATPYLYIYYILILPTKIPKGLLFTLSFLMGFSLDVFCNTPGMHIIATLITAALRTTALLLFFSNEEIESSSPSAFSYGLWRFILYASSLVFVHHFVLLVIESFVLTDIWMLIEKIILSVLFTSFLIFFIETIKLARK